MQNFLRIILLLLSTSLFFTACTDEESELGLKLQDPNSILNTYPDTTIKVEAYTFLHDSLKTSKAAVHLLGFYKDNVFGQVDASIYSQVSLRDNRGFELQGAYTLDSLILSMAFSGIYPLDQSTRSLYVEVYQLSGNMYVDSSYYATSSVPHESSPIFQGNVVFNSKDSISLSGEKYPPQIRMRLSDDFMNKIGTRKFTTNEDFVNFVKGLYIKVKPDASVGAIGYFDLTSVYSGMSLYYHGATSGDSIYRFIFDPNAAHFEHFDHNYTGTPLSSFMSNRKDSINGSSKIYLESLGGTYFKFRFPELKNLRENHYAINLATLVITVPEPVSGTETNVNTDPPSTIFCLMNTGTGGVSTILDLVSSGVAVSVSYDPAKRQYRVPLSRHIQNMLNGHYDDWGINVYVTSATTTANRVVLNGTNTPSSPLRLEIIYTK